MKNAIFHTLLTLFASTALATLLFPVVQVLGLRAGLVDRPGARKLHRKAVPVVGGIALVLVAAGVLSVFPSLRAFVLQYSFVFAGAAVVACTGMLDDKYNMSARLRLLLEFCCALAAADAGIRIGSLHGFLGIHQIPVLWQYLLTAFVITGVTNAINLMDGINGLVGAMALMNFVVLALIAIWLHQDQWARLAAIMCGGLILFLTYNWRTGTIFLGDAGSLFIGFIMSVTAIRLANAPTLHTLRLADHTLVIATIAACFIIPVADALRVFIQRANAGQSPFTADKSHLHHKLICHFLPHHAAARRLLLLHAGIMILSAVMRLWYGVTVILLLQAAIVIAYTLFLDFVQSFSRWYRAVKRLETTP